MISPTQNDALKIIANAAQRNTDWTDYVNYCLNREKGLRQEAFKSLEIFLKKMQKCSFEQKKIFVNFLFPFFEAVRDADYSGFPYPLSHRLLRPVLDEWCKIETINNNPFRWYGRYYNSEAHLLKALELNPMDDVARTILISWSCDRLFDATHYLPDYYIGDPYQDIVHSEKIQRQIALLNSQKLKDKWTRELQEYIELIQNYIDWKKSGLSNFAQWAKRISDERIAGCERYIITANKNATI